MGEEKSPSVNNIENGNDNNNKSFNNLDKLVLDSKNLDSPGTHKITYPNTVGQRKSNDSSDISSILSSPSSPYAMYTGYNKNNGTPSHKPLQSPTAPPSSRDSSLRHQNKVIESGHRFGNSPKSCYSDQRCDICLMHIDDETQISTTTICCGKIYHYNCVTSLGWISRGVKYACVDCIQPTEDVDDHENSSDEENELFYANIPKDRVNQGDTITSKTDKLKVYIHGQRYIEAIKTVVGGYSKYIDTPSEINIEYIRQHHLTMEDLLVKRSINIIAIIEMIGAKDLQDLINFGLKSEHLFHLQSFRRYLANRFQFNYSQLRILLEVKLYDLYPLSSKSLRAWGFRAHELCVMGMQKHHLCNFTSINMSEWTKDLGLSKMHIMLLDIKRVDFDMPHENSQSLLGEKWSLTALKTLLDYTVDELILLELVNQSDIKHLFPKPMPNQIKQEEIIYNIASPASIQHQRQYTLPREMNFRSADEFGSVIGPGAQKREYTIPKVKSYDTSGSNFNSENMQYPEEILLQSSSNMARGTTTTGHQQYQSRKLPQPSNTLFIPGGGNRKIK